VVGADSEAAQVSDSSPAAELSFAHLVALMWNYAEQPTSVVRSQWFKVQGKFQGSD
jgi:hypothetical protein